MSAKTENTSAMERIIFIIIIMV